MAWHIVPSIENDVARVARHSYHVSVMSYNYTTGRTGPIAYTNVLSGNAMLCRLYVDLASNCIAMQRNTMHDTTQHEMA